MNYSNVMFTLLRPLVRAYRYLVFTATEKKMDNTVQAHEENASDTMWPNIKEHVNYLSELYGLCFGMQKPIDGKAINTFGDVFRAQMMILMRITDFIRCIQLLSVKCYPEQAGALAASIYELVHTGLYFSHDEEAAKKWLSSDDVKAKMPESIMPDNAKRHEKNWRELTRLNYEEHKKEDHFPNSQDVNYKREYGVYKQLCWMKHSLPKMQDMIVEKGGTRFQFGPYTDERAKNHLLFVLLNSGRLTEMLISAIISNHEEFSSVPTQLQNIAKKRAGLWEVAKKESNTPNPFTQPEKDK